MTFRKVAAFLAILALSACSTRSISNSGYAGHYGEAANPFYQGEIDTLDLLVPAAQTTVSHAQIEAALADRKPVRIELGQPLLVIQSGALVPDEAMMADLKGHFAATPFSGIPSQPFNNQAGAGQATYGDRLRLAAANGGYRHILIYWGKLEAASSGGITKAISWIPIVGAVVPDESQHMRIVLNAAIVDVATGRWRQISPEPVEDEAISASINRASSDQDQVAKLKELGYTKLAALVIDQAMTRPWQ